MKTRGFIVVVLTLITFTVGVRSCLKRTEEPVSGANANVTKGSATPPQDMLTFYNAALPKYQTLLGSRKLCKIHGKINEMSGENIEWIEDEITEVDKLNNVSQRFMVIHAFSFTRELRFDKWEDWVERQAIPTGFALSIERRGAKLVETELPMALRAFFGFAKVLTEEDVKRLPPPEPTK